MQGLVIIMCSVISAVVVKTVYMTCHDLSFRKKNNNDAKHTKNIK